MDDWAGMCDALMDCDLETAAMDDWARMCDALMDCDLETAAEVELALASGIRRKRPDGWAVHLGLLKLLILDFT